MIVQLNLKLGKSKIRLNGRTVERSNGLKTFQLFDFSTFQLQKERKMDIMKMMKQAQNLQQKLKETQDELSKTEVTGESAGGAVKVIVDGQGRFKSIKLSPEAINPENPSSIDADMVEMLEDVITTAITQASKKATDEMETKMKSLTGGLNIPGMSGLL